MGVVGGLFCGVVVVCGVGFWVVLGWLLDWVGVVVVEWVVDLGWFVVCGEMLSG